MVGFQKPIVLRLAVFVALLFSVFNAYATSPNTTLCQQTAQDARRTLKLYDGSLRDVARLGTDPDALANLTTAFDAISSDYTAILLACQVINNTAPHVSITSPAEGAVFTSGSTIEFSGNASDAEDGALSGSIQWSSSLTGALGAGATLSTVLPDGLHTITAEVVDSQGEYGSAAVHITVGATQSPTISIASISSNVAFVGKALPILIAGEDPTPQGFEAFASGATVSFRNSVTGAEFSVDASFIDQYTLTTTLPTNMPAGSYDVSVTNPDNAYGVLPNGLLITDTLNINILSIDPTAISNTVDAGVLITTEPSDPSGSILSFQTGASVQFYEVNQGTALLPSNITFVDSEHLSATISAGAAPGVYDLYVINPDGSAGLLPNALTISGP